MPTLHRRAQQHEKRTEYFTDMLLAYTAGFWTCAFCSLVFFVLWNLT